MSPKTFAFATVTVLTLAAALPAQAQIWPFGRDRQAPPAEEPAATPPPAPVVPERRVASAEDRARAARLDPLSRAVFWAAEVSIAPEDVEAYLFLSQAQRELRRYAEAADSAQQALLIAPGDRRALMQVARAKIAEGQAFYAIAPLEQARALQPQDWEAVSLLGVALDQVGRRDEAHQAWQEALVLSPDNPSILTNIALSMAAGGQTADAEALLRRAVALPGSTTQMRLNLALMIGLQGRTAEAEQILRRELPPEMVEQNLSWLRQTSTSAPPTRRPHLGGPERQLESPDGSGLARSNTASVTRFSAIPPPARLTARRNALCCAALPRPRWRNGRRGRLKICWPKGRVGSSPTRGTKASTDWPRSLSAQRPSGPSQP
jgi:Flp pilus assembly protein TadD